MAEDYNGDMGHSMGSKKSGNMGKDPMVPCISKHSLASDGLYRKDCVGGQPAGMGSTKVFGTGEVSGGSRKGTSMKTAPAMKRGKNLSHKK